MNRHEDDTEHTFPALPPVNGRGFARTWWGRAWLRALEDTALDGEQVRTGRGLARAGAVGAVSVRPGRITAVVQGRDGTRHRADVLLEALPDDRWDRFLDLAVERSGHVAALFDREMPRHLVEDAAAAGVDLLPGTGDLEPECDCGAWDHCGHTAALCHQVARLLDQDPFLLLLVRGRGERALLADLRTRATTPADTPPRPEGVDALEAYAAGGVLPPLPDPPALPEKPGRPPSLDTGTPPAPGVDPTALEFLVARTAEEAHRLLAEVLRDGVGPGAGPDAEASVPGVSVRGADLTLSQDAVRLASAGSPDIRLSDRLAEGSGRSRAELALAVGAWRQDGPTGLSMLEEQWTVEGESRVRARAALESAWEEDERPTLRARGNRWTAVGTPGQVRLGRDGRWWPYRKAGTRWVPAGEPARDPATALASALSDPDDPDVFGGLGGLGEFRELGE
ncbi:SWIM zinc finger family protein [Streptomyces sp. NPDC002306]